MFDICFVIVVCLLFVKNKQTHYLSQTFAIPFTILINLVYLRYCKIYDRLKGYKDTDLASLTYSVTHLTIVLRNLVFSSYNECQIKPSNLIELRSSL